MFRHNRRTIIPVDRFHGEVFCVCTPCDRAWTVLRPVARGPRIHSPRHHKSAQEERLETPDISDSELRWRGDCGGLIFCRLCAFLGACGRQGRCSKRPKTCILKTCAEVRKVLARTFHSKAWKSRPAHSSVAMAWDHGVGTAPLNECTSPCEGKRCHGRG